MKPMTRVGTIATQHLPDLPSDEIVRAQPVSERRVRNLFDNYLRERQLTRTTEMLFARVGALDFKHLPAPEDVGDFGFKAIVSKHSFLEGVNSLIVSAQGWAMGQEDFLLKYFGENLLDAVNGYVGEEVVRDASAILSALKEMAVELRGQGLEPSAFAVTGSTGQALFEELRRATQNPWNWYRQVNHSASRATHRFIGVHEGIPFIAIESVRAPMLFAVDLARFGTLTRFGKGPNYDPEFEVNPFTDDAARDELARQPNLILEPRPERGNESERIRQLRLRVGLELWETFKLDVQDPAAVVARPLVDLGE